MGFKEHVGIKVATYFTSLLKKKDDLRKITNTQADQLSIEKDDIIMKARFFKSFNSKGVYSAIFTTREIVILPCKLDWKSEDVIVLGKANFERYKIDKGNLFGSALRIKSIAEI